MTQKHIMLVDDDPLNNLLTIQVMNRTVSRLKVSEYQKAGEALAYLIKGQDLPSVVMLDINMPEIDGWKFLDELLNHNLTIDVVMLTSSISKHDRDRAKSYRMVKDFIVKPLTQDKFKTAIGKYLQ